MSIDDDIDFLDGVPTFAVLGRDALRILAIGAEPLRLRAGDALFRIGEISDAGYLIQHGAISLATSESEGGREMIVGAGTLLGEYALLAETRRPATATVMENTTVLRIPRSLFLKMLEGFPEAAHRLRAALSARAQQTMQEVFGARQLLDEGPPD